jgi:hypothetical protein
LRWHVISNQERTARTKVTSVAGSLCGGSLVPKHSLASGSGASNPTEVVCPPSLATDRVPVQRMTPVVLQCSWQRGASRGPVCCSLTQRRGYQIVTKFGLQMSRRIRFCSTRLHLSFATEQAFIAGAPCNTDADNTDTRHVQ